MTSPPVVLDQNLLDVRLRRIFRIFNEVRQLRPRPNGIGKKILRQRARSMRRGLRAKAILAQQGSDQPMEGPNGLLEHLNRHIVHLSMKAATKTAKEMPL